MALPNVTIQRGSGTSGRQGANFDPYSGLVFYGTAPVISGKWATQAGTPNIKFQEMFSANDATLSGIVPYADNTASTSTYLITTKGNTGDKVVGTVTVPIKSGLTQTITLFSYTVPSGDNTIALQGAAIVALINAGTVTHGFSASFNTATFTITAPTSYGIALNTGTPYVYTITGAFAGTDTQNVVAGTYSPYAIWYYHISEYFRVNPTGVLYVCIISASSSFNETVTLQAAANSKIRQIGIYDNDTTRPTAANITGTLLQLHNAVTTLQQTAPVYAIYSPNIQAISDLSTYPDQNLNTAFKTQCVISQDGLASGALLYTISGQSIGNIGAKLGSLSKSRVSASDAQAISDFNMSDGVENNVPAFANGALASTISSGLQTQLDNYRYTFFRQFGDTVVGTYWTDNKSCVVSSSDYAFANDNRVFDKVSRLLYSAYVPLLSGEIIFNPDGTMTDTSVAYLIEVGQDAVTENMITGFGSNPEIGGITITIDPTQPVRQTNQLVINAVINENGIARNIQINLSF